MPSKPRSAFAILISPAFLRAFLLGAVAVLGTTYALVRHYAKERERAASTPASKDPASNDPASNDPASGSPASKAAGSASGATELPAPELVPVEP